MLSEMNRPNGQQCLAKITPVFDGSTQMLIAMKQLYIPVYMNVQDMDKWNYRQYRWTAHWLHPCKHEMSDKAGMHTRMHAQ